MARHHKVVWYEGMSLDPHHLQQWDRASQGVLHARIRSLARYDWGITELEIDREGLANGQFSVLRCRGVTPDGLPFNCPDEDPLPETRAFDKYFPATEEKLGVFMAIPVERLGGSNCLLDGETAKRETRFIMERINLPDDNTGVDERQIGVAKPNFKLRFESEPREDYSTLKIAEVMRAPDGAFELSKDFIPPCLSIAASENLTAIARRLLELLVAKSADLWERRRQQPSGQIEFTTADVTVFWLLHTVNTFIPLLNHHYTVTKCHPETLYSVMLMLAGQLTTFSATAQIHPRDFPKYDHNNLSDSFNQLDAIIRELLGEVISRNYVAIPLEKKSEALWIGKVVEDRLFQTAQFYLVGSGEIPERKVVDELPRKLKIAAPESIHALTAAALQGLSVTYSSRPPVGMPSRPGMQYFRLEKVGPFWEAICRSRAIAIFVPAEFMGLKLELVAVREGG